MRVPALDNRRTAEYAQRFRQEGDSETRQRAAGLRRQHEQTTAQLRARLPFAWQVGKVRPRYQGPSCWEHVPAAIHIQLLEAVTLAPGTPQAQMRAVGDWLCQPALDTSTGEVRYEMEAAPDHCDGTGGPAAYYRPMPSCKKCLKKAQQLFSNPHFMNYAGECPTCGESCPRPNHKCPPAWLVRNADDDESEAYTIYDHTAPGAAEKFCLRMDDGESKPRDRKVTVERKVEYGGQRLGPSHYDMHAEVVFQYLPF